MKQVFVSFLILFSAIRLVAQPADFIPGGNTIFEDNFSMDPVGDFPARWSTSSEGAVVELDGFPGKWLKINGNVAVNPELKKKLPEDCTIEFDVVMKQESCRLLFGLTPISDMSAGNVFYKKLSVTCQNMTGYPDVVFSKNVQDIGSKRFDLDGYTDRILHVSISVNKTRMRVWLDEEKVMDMPKVVTPEFRNNFFIAGGESIPAPPDGIYISNVRIAAGTADARRLLIKQLFEQGSVVTNDISFNPQTNEMTQASYAVLDTLGQALVADPNLNIQINGDQIPEMVQGKTGKISEEAVRQKVDKMKSYLVDKFNLQVDRIVTGVSNKIRTKSEALKNSKTGTKVKGFLTEIVKL